MNSTTTLEFNFIDVLLKTIDSTTKSVYWVLWNTLLSFLIKHWMVVVTILIVTLIVAIIRAIIGRWGMLGSVLYNYLYFGILFAVGLIWGSDVFVSNWFSVVCTVILYPVCYFVVRLILEKTGLK